jgi:hypothetical protein
LHIPRLRTPVVAIFHHKPQSQPQTPVTIPTSPYYLPSSPFPEPFSFPTLLPPFLSSSFLLPITYTKLPTYFSDFDNFWFVRKLNTGSFVVNRKKLVRTSAFASFLERSQSSAECTRERERGGERSSQKQSRREARATKFPVGRSPSSLPRSNALLSAYRLLVHSRVARRIKLSNCLKLFSFYFHVKTIFSDFFLAKFFGTLWKKNSSVNLTNFPFFFFVLENFTKDLLRNPKP